MFYFRIRSGPVFFPLKSLNLICSKGFFLKPFKLERLNQKQQQQTQPPKEEEVPSGTKTLPNSFAKELGKVINYVLGDLVWVFLDILFIHKKHMQLRKRFRLEWKLGS